MTATPQLGQRLERWLGDCAASVDARCELTVDGAKRVEAVFSGEHEPPTIVFAGGSDQPDEKGEGVAIDSLTGDVYTTGRFEGTVNFGTGNIPSDALFGMHVAAYQADSSPRWAQSVGTGIDNRVTGLRSATTLPAIFAGRGLLVAILMTRALALVSTTKALYM